MAYKDELYFIGKKELFELKDEVSVLPNGLSALRNDCLSGLIFDVTILFKYISTYETVSLNIFELTKQ